VNAGQIKLYPVDFTDREIHNQIRESAATLAKASYNINTVLQHTPIIQIGVVELETRRQKAEAELNRQSAEQHLELGRQSLQLGEQAKTLGTQQLQLGAQSVNLARWSMLIAVVSLLVAALAVWVTIDLQWSDPSDEIIIGKLQTLIENSHETNGYIIKGSQRVESSVKELSTKLSEGVVVRVEPPINPKRNAEKSSP